MIIPKGNGGFRGFGIVELLWKALLGFINQWIGSALQFHNVLHGLRVGWGTGTTSLKANFFQQLTKIREEILY